MNPIITGSLAVVLAALLWSLDGTFLRPSLYSLPAPLVVFLEHLLGFAALLPFLIRDGYQVFKLSARQWLAIFWVALFGGALGTLFLTQALFLTGFKDISVVLLLQKFQPLFAIVLSAIFLRERFPPKFYLYALLALVGGYLIAFKDPFTFKVVTTTSVAIASYSLLAAFAWGSATTFGKYSLKNISFGLLAALRFGFTAIIMLFFAWPVLGQVSQVTSIEWRTLLIIVCTSGAFGMYLYYFGLIRIPASLATLCELAWPFSAVIFDYAFNGNKLSGTQLFGAVVLIISVIRVTYLNRSHKISGIVKAGFNQGDKTGARTANLDIANAGSLSQGLYLGRIVLDRETHPALLYYGHNILSGQLCLEVHVLNFSGDIYGKQISVTTERYLRTPKKFTTLEKLAAQIKKDLAFAQSL